MKIECVSCRPEGENKHCIVKAGGKWFESKTSASLMAVLSEIRMGAEGMTVISEADAKMKIGRMFFEHE